jgi:hypothetical protein
MRGCISLLPVLLVSTALLSGQTASNQRKRFDRYFLLTGKAAYLAPNSFYFGAAGRLQAVLQRHSDRYEVDLVLSRQ